MKKVRELIEAIDTQCLGGSLNAQLKAQALSELDNIQQQMESEELVEKATRGWINSYAEYHGLNELVNILDADKRYMRAAIKVISNQLKGE